MMMMVCSSFNCVAFFPFWFVRLIRFSRACFMPIPLCFSLGVSCVCLSENNWDYFIAWHLAIIFYFKKTRCLPFSLSLSLPLSVFRLFGLGFIVMFSIFSTHYDRHHRKFASNVCTHRCSSMNVTRKFHSDSVSKCFQRMWRCYLGYSNYFSQISLHFQFIASASIRFEEFVWISSPGFGILSPTISRKCTSIRISLACEIAASIDPKLIHGCAQHVIENMLIFTLKKSIGFRVSHWNYDNHRFSWSIDLICSD